MLYASKPDGQTTVERRSNDSQGYDEADDGERIETLCSLSLNFIQQYRETSFIASDDIRQPI